MTAAGSRSPRLLRPFMVGAAIVTALAVPLVLAYSGLTVLLGAHPRWAASTAWIGVAAGFVAALGLVPVRLRRLRSVQLAAVTVVLAGTAAHFGKEAFVLSYAENAMAGRFWYFGWISVFAGVTLLAVLTLWPRKRVGPPK